MNGLGAQAVAVNANILTTDPTKRSDFTWIYFLNVNREMVKIGHSRQKRGERQKQHEKSKFGFTPNIELICELKGSVSDEKAIHRHFARFRVPGDEKELFYPSDEVLDYVRWLRDMWFVAVPDTTDEQREALPIEDFTHWSPGGNHSKTPPKGELFGDKWAFGDREITGDDFYTNKIVIDAARQVMGRIDVDPASHALANKVVGATTFYTKADNGLMRKWSGKVWINPPFSAWSVWVPKILNEWNSGRIEEMCVLSAMRTVTAQYFAPFVAASDAICIMKGRIKFWGGKAGDSPDDGHAVFYFGKNREGFLKAFSDLGTTFYSAK